jgi:hypothetical protein
MNEEEGLDTLIAHQLWRQGYNEQDLSTQVLEDLVEQESNRRAKLPLQALRDTTTTMLPACLLYGALLGSVSATIMVTLLTGFVVYPANLISDAYSLEKEEKNGPRIRRKYDSKREEAKKEFRDDYTSLVWQREVERQSIIGVRDIYLLIDRITTVEMGRWSSFSVNVYIPDSGLDAVIYVSHEEEALETGDSYNRIREAALIRYKQAHAYWDKQIEARKEVHRQALQEMNNKERAENQIPLRQSVYENLTQKVAPIKNSAAYLGLFTAIGLQGDKPVEGFIVGASYAMYRAGLTLWRKRNVIGQSVKRVIKNK